MCIIIWLTKACHVSLLNIIDSDHKLFKLKDKFFLEHWQESGYDDDFN